MLDPFTAWQTWEESPRFTSASFRETLDGGQAFRWECSNDYYEGRWGTVAVRLRLREPTQMLEYSHLASSDSRQVLDALHTYFALDTDFAALADQLPWRSDPVLKTAMQAFPNLRILRQPLGECLFSFLCSSTKQIPQIKAIHSMVAQDLGVALSDGSHALPSWETIAAAGEAPLRAAKLGYRARYIHQCAQYIAAHPGWLDALLKLPTDLAREQMMTLPGVGRKIADCVLLFGAGRYDAFPIDTWIEKILCRAYGLNDWKMPQLQRFAQIHFGELSGYAQQYLFAAARAGLLETNSKTST